MARLILQNQPRHINWIKPHLPQLILHTLFSHILHYSNIGKKYRKITALTVAFVLGCVLLSACGNAETNDAKVTEATDDSGNGATDENTILISTSDDVNISDTTVTKTGDSDGGDTCNFYGLNAAVLVKDGSTTTITGGTITSDAEGANGVFCYGGNGGQNGAEGDGTTVIIKDTSIETSGNGSGGIMTTGGGTTYAYNLDVTTSGRSSAPIRTDRGGGTVYVDGVALSGTK